jgi:secretion/DNA translocation related TadE-like protein
VRPHLPRRARTCRERGSATIWVLAACVLVLLAGSAAMLRTEAVLARHRAETAADLAALAAAGRIGVGADYCAAARQIASADGAELGRCRIALDADGRSGTVTVRVRANVHLPVVGARTVTASARAGRLKAGDAAPTPGA